MKHKILFFFYITCCLLIYPTGSFGTEKETEKNQGQDKTTQTVSETPQKFPLAFLPESEYEFSPVLEGTTVTHDFIIQNKGDAELKINRVKTG